MDGLKDVGVCVYDDAGAADAARDGAMDATADAALDQDATIDAAITSDGAGCGPGEFVCPVRCFSAESECSSAPCIPLNCPPPPSQDASLDGP
jgi:hypothetical protein